MSIQELLLKKKRKIVTQRFRKLGTLVVTTTMFVSGIPSVHAATWTEQVDAGVKYWSSVDASSDGEKIAAVAESEFVYTSADGGVNWTEIDTTFMDEDFNGITSSDDGEDLAAIANFSSYVYTSSDSGATWTQHSFAEISGSAYMTGIDSSDDGQSIVAVSGAGYSGGGYIYTSTNGGTSWTLQGNAGQEYWTAVTISSDGQRIAAAVDSEYIHTSTDGGVTWTEQTGSDTASWDMIDSSADNEVMIAAAGYSLTVSTDGGETWGAPAGTASGEWQSVFVSDDGEVVAAVGAGGYVNVSTDGGSTFVPDEESPAESWNMLSGSDAGDFLIAGIYDGSIYTADIVLPGDTTAPSVSNIEIVPNQYDVVISWDTNEAATSTIEYGATASYGEEGASDAFVTSHEYTLSGLIPATTYHFRFSVSDAAGNSTTTADQTFVTDNEEQVGGNSGSSRRPTSKKREPAAVQQTSVAAPSQGNSLMGFIPVRDLYLGLEGIDVQMLQLILMIENKGTAAQALTAAGATGYFGPLTQAALAEFQAQAGIMPAAGYFGPLTQAYMIGAGIDNLWW